MSAKKLALYAMLAAMCAVLGYLSIDIGNFGKITFESFPVLLAAFVFGPVGGMIVGAIGTFIYQLLKYGLMLTTPLWMLPYIICGLVAGLGAKILRKMGRINVGGSLVVVIISKLLLTILNTGVMYLDGIIGGYDASYALATLLPRLAICIGEGVVFGIVIVPIYRVLNKEFKKEQQNH